MLQESVMIRWRLRVLMAERNISTQALANHLGMSRASISRLRNTPHDAYPRISGAVLNKLCQVLKCEPADLIEYRPDEDAQRQSQA